MAESPAFVPRSWLVHEADFGVESEDEEWHLATTLAEMMQLARSIEQHHLAVEVNRRLRRHKNSVADLAAVLDQRRETVAAKLNGSRPAGTGDLFAWAWMVRRSTLRVPPISELLAPGDDGQPVSPVPEFPLPRRRDRSSKRLG